MIVWEHTTDIYICKYSICQQKGGLIALDERGYYDLVNMECRGRQN